MTVSHGTIVGRGDGVSNGSATDSGIIVDADVCRAGDGWIFIISDDDIERTIGRVAAGIGDDKGIGGGVPMGMWLRRLALRIG